MTANSGGLAFAEEIISGSWPDLAASFLSSLHTLAEDARQGISDLIREGKVNETLAQPLSVALDWVLRSIRASKKFSVLIGVGGTLFQATSAAREVITVHVGVHQGQMGEESIWDRVLEPLIVMEAVAVFLAYRTGYQSLVIPPTGAMGLAVLAKHLQQPITARLRLLEETLKPPQIEAGPVGEADPDEG